VKFSLRFVLILTALVAAAVLVLAVACGGGDEEGPAAGETPAAAEETPEGSSPGETGELPDIPLYPGATDVLTQTYTGGEGPFVPTMGEGDIDPGAYDTVKNAMYETSASFEDVIDFYKEEFKGWKEEGSFSTEQMGQKGQAVVWSKDDGNLAAWLSVAESEGTTIVIISIGAGQ
jgi:hypothetical protein